VALGAARNFGAKGGERSAKYPHAHSGWRSCSPPARETPRVVYMPVHAHGDPVKMAEAVWGTWDAGAVGRHAMSPSGAPEAATPEWRAQVLEAVTATRVDTHSIK
jgi:hypothetical protein